MFQHVVTAADSKFKPILPLWKERVQACGLTPVIYDLGGLGEGTPFQPTDVPGFDNFLKYGYYVKVGENWKSRALHKPYLIERAMTDLNAPFLYTDMDAFLRGKPSKMAGDWEACVTMRHPTERERTSAGAIAYTGRLVNAGVIWFNCNEESKKFVMLWKALTVQELNDQRAINLLVIGAEVGQVYNANGIRIMAVPGEVYNHYYKENVDRAAIIHLKNSEWADKDRDALLKRLGLYTPPCDHDHAPKPKGIFGKLFGGRSKPTPVQHVHHHHTTVYDDSGVDLLRWYGIYHLWNDLTGDHHRTASMYPSPVPEPTTGGLRNDIIPDQPPAPDVQPAADLTTPLAAVVGGAGAAAYGLTTGVDNPPDNGDNAPPQQDPEPVNFVAPDPEPAPAAVADDPVVPDPMPASDPEPDPSGS